ncbi:MAG: methyl-accepting chemotaxis protein [Desulfovibrionales bacterium]|nr:methyl-accepting chemotaxis protein [Desulfovibrionales bacterium]
MLAIRRSLGLKVLALTSLLTVAAFSGLFLASSYWQRKATLQEVRVNAHRTADLLQMAIEEPMRLGDNTGTEDQFTKISNRYDDIAICLTNFRGEITYSTSNELIRKNIYDVYQCGPFKAMVDKSLAAPSEMGEVITGDGEAHFVEIKSIENAPDCHHCHGSSRPILGALVMLQDVSRQFAALRSDQLSNAAISVIGMAALLASLLLFMKRSVINRIKTIAATSEEVANGDMHADFTVAGSDELAGLADNLGAMVRQINQLEVSRSILEGISAPLMVANRKEEVDFCNEPLRAILDMHQETKGMKVAYLFKGEQQFQKAVHDVIATGASATDVVRYVREDGAEFPLHFDCSPLRDGENNIAGAILVLIDLTEQEEARKNIELQQQKLMEVAELVTSVAQSLNGSSDAMSKRMADLTESVDTTAEQVGQVAAAMEEMNATVLEVAKNADTTAQTSDKANQIAKESGKVVRATVDEIQDVASTTEQLAGALQDLSDRVENIGQVVAVINDIADQTNLLALNAAIEAARAGDAGRGFAVVADEVRKLAEKTMSATEEVENAIHLIQQGAHSAVQSMGEARERIVDTAQKAQSAGKVLDDIVDQSDIIADMVRNIATAAEEQSATSDEINLNVNHINDLTHVLTSGIQEAGGLITDVASMSQRLTELVQGFKQ